MRNQEFTSYAVNTQLKFIEPFVNSAWKEYLISYFDYRGGCMACSVSLFIEDLLNGND